MDISYALILMGCRAVRTGLQVDWLASMNYRTTEWHMNKAEEMIIYDK